MATRTLTISIRPAGAATIVDLNGAIDLGNSPALRTALFDQLPRSARLAVNMKGIRYIDSSGIATLIEVLKKSRDVHSEFLLFGLGSAVYDVLKLTKLLGVFHIVDSEEDALRDPAL
jgi:anti-sigma B factor antagonist